MNESLPASSGVPVVTDFQVIPVSGHDSMLLNLSGAHSPFLPAILSFLATAVVMSVLVKRRGGEGLFQTLVDARSLVMRQSQAFT